MNRQRNTIIVVLIFLLQSPMFRHERKENCVQSDHDTMHFNITSLPCYINNLLKYTQNESEQTATPRSTTAMSQYLCIIYPLPTSLKIQRHTEMQIHFAQRQGDKKRVKVNITAPKSLHLFSACPSRHLQSTYYIFCEDVSMTN